MLQTKIPMFGQLPMHPPFPPAPNLSRTAPPLDLPWLMASSRSLAALFAATLTACSGSLAQTAPLHLIPMPREIHPLPVQPLPRGVHIVSAPDADADDRFAAQDLAATLQARGIATTDPTGLPIRLTRLATHPVPDFDPAMKPEGYVITFTPGSSAELTVTADSAAGLFYGAQTVKQLLDGGPGVPAVLNAADIRDWPAMQYRGLDDDLSRGPVTTLEFEKKLIRTLAAYKINLYSPYFEHTLQYASDPLAAPPGSSLTRAESQELAAFAARYHITIVPEQEAFGHLHHILQYEKYSALAETPHGHVLAPGAPGTQPLIYSWFSQIAQDFPSPFLHVGADETFELGTGRTNADVDKRGLGPVYADFLSQIHTTLAPLHRKLLYWGDVATGDPSAIDHLPKDMIAISWIYWHLDNYDSNITPFKNAGIETWVAPGDANWRNVYPNGKLALDNIQGFVEAGQRLGSTGELLTIWNDDGEGLFDQDWFGVLFGAATAWQPGKSDPAPYERAFGQTFYGDPTGKIDQAQAEIMAAQGLIDPSNDAFWTDPWSPAGQKLAAKLRPNLHEGRLHAERALDLLAAVQISQTNLHELNAIKAMELGARRLDLTAEKFQLSDEMAAAYAQAYALTHPAHGQHPDEKQNAQARELLYSISSMNGRCQDLRDAYSMLKTLYAQSWLAENRPFWLDNVTVRYDLRIQLWQQRGEAIDTLINAWFDTKNLPTAQQAGLPAPPPQPDNQLIK
jgi:hexosaminidase